MTLRAILVVLLVLNLGVAVWWLAGGATPPVPPQVGMPAGVARLQLVGEHAAAANTTSQSEPDRTASAAGPERPPVPASAPATPASTTTPGSAGSVSFLPADLPEGARCFRFGPFDARPQAEGMWEQVIPTVVAARVREEPVTGTSARWSVAIAAQDSPAAAQALSRRLTAAGFKDHYIVSGGPPANSIALGQFDSEAAAARHVDALAKAGFTARVGAPAVRLRYWVEVAARQGFDATAARQSAGAQRMRELGCARLG